MEQTTPQWITGTLYGSATLEWRENGKWLNCPVWVRLLCERVTWEVAAPVDAVPYHRQGILGRLKNVVLQVEDGSTYCHIESLDLSHIRPHTSSVLAIEECDRIAPLQNWAQIPEEPSDFPYAYELLSVHAISETKLHVENRQPRQSSSVLQGNCYQLPKDVGQWPLDLPCGNKVHVHSQPQGSHFLVSLWSTTDWSDYREAVLLALQLFAHSPAQLVQTIEGCLHTFHPSKKYLPVVREFVQLRHSAFVYIPKITQKLLELSKEEFQRFKISTLYHLHAKASDASEEVRYSMEMTWLEMVDDSRQLCACKTASLLGISVEAADFLKEIRNKLIHEQGTLANAVNAALNGIFERLKIRGNVIQEAAHINKIRVALGIGQETPLELYIGFRLTERIDIALWNFVCIAVNDLNFSELVKWPHAVPLPSKDLDLQPLIEKPKKSKAHKNAVLGCPLKRACQ